MTDVMKPVILEWIPGCLLLVFTRRHQNSDQETIGVLTFCFNELLQHLNTFIQTNVRFEMVLRFGIEGT